MDEEETKLCSNCKREIPAVNFTIHTVHCARNIKVCPVCKEPVPVSELEEHHDKLHRLLPCKQCGESVCGTDLEDHIRDSCAHTIQSCRYCELEVPRRDVPAHEGYCGARTEQCAQCREWVMIKYRQLHQDSNHGFLRLDDDPIPQPRREPPRREPLRPIIPTTPVIPKLNPPKTVTKPSTNYPNLIRPRTEIRYLNASGDPGPSSSGLPSVSSATNVPRPVVNGIGTNDQPQMNPVERKNKVNKEIASSRGAVRKRQAPAPPRAPPADPRRDLALRSALARKQDEDTQREDQTKQNLAKGLPPVLSPAAKLDKLRKMDALHNRETEQEDYKQRLQGRVWMPPDVPAGNVLGSESSSSAANLEPSRRKVEKPRNGVRNQVPLDRNDLAGLTPMTPEEFMTRFSALQVGGAGDRFSQIKSSLQELRRGLNEVTAPYNSNNSINNANNVNQNSCGGGRCSRAGGVSSDEESEEEEVRLPCEFCNKLVPAQKLVQHQTGCRPDLAQLRPRSLSPRPAPRAPPPAPCAPPPDPYEQPVIPCEFCTESLPVYLINEHQERCRREQHELYAD